MNANQLQIGENRNTINSPLAKLIVADDGLFIFGLKRVGAPQQIINGHIEDVGELAQCGK